MTVVRRCLSAVPVGVPTLRMPRRPGPAGRVGRASPHAVCSGEIRPQAVVREKETNGFREEAREPDERGGGMIFRGAAAAAVLIINKKKGRNDNEKI